MSNFSFSKADITVNVFSFFGLSGAGIVLNILAVQFYGNDGLGFLSQLFSLYLVLAQIMTFGVQQSILSSGERPMHDRSLLLSALLLSVMISSVMFFLLWFTLSRLLLLFDFLDVHASLYPILCACMLFAMNKVLICNFLRAKKLKLSAMSGTLRAMLLIGFLAWFKHSAQPLEMLAWVFVWAELGLLVFQLGFSGESVKGSACQWPDLKRDMMRHLNFGKKAVIGGMIYEFNAKIDVFVLTCYVSRELLGVYTFAVTIASGYVQFIALFKNMNTNNFSKILQQGGKSLSSLETPAYQRLRRCLYGLACVTLLLYKPFSAWVTGDAAIVEQGFWIYGLYMIGLTIATKSLLLDNVFILSQNPLGDSGLRVAMVVLNLLCSVLFVPIVGVYGAALSVVICLLFNAWWVRWYVRYTFMQPPIGEI